MKEEERKIKAIIFDVGGVLEIGKVNLKQLQNKHYHTGVHEYIAKKLKIPMDQWIDSMNTSYELSMQGKISREKTLNTIAKNNNISSTKLRKIIFKAHKRNFKTNKQLFKQAFKIKQLGYKIAVLSDQWHLSYDAVMKNNKLFKKFNPVIVSCKVGIRKPNPKIYQLTLKKLKLKPEECLFIDNQKWNLLPAKELGIKTILFKNNKQLFENKIWKSLFE